MIDIKKKIDWNKVFNALMILIAVCMIVFSCVYQNNLVNLLNTLHSLDKVWIFVGIISVLISWFLDSTVLRLIIGSVETEKLGVFKTLKVTISGQFYSAITPMGVAGQPMMLLLLTRYGISSGTAISILVRKFLIYQSTLVVYSLFAIVTQFVFFSHTISGFATLSVVGLICQAFPIVVLLLFSFNRTLTTNVIHWFFNIISKFKFIKNSKKLGENVETQLDFYLENNKKLGRNHKLNIKLYLLTALQLTTLFAVPFFIYKAYGYPGFPILNMISSQAFVTMAASCIPLPGGAGANEGGFIVIFGSFFDANIIAQAMLLWRFMTYYLSVLAGLFFARVKRKEKAPKEEYLENSCEESR